MASFFNTDLTKAALSKQHDSKRIAGIRQPDRPGLSEEPVFTFLHSPALTRN